MKVNFLSFADAKYARTLDRIKNEAYNMKIFDNVMCFNENDIEDKIKEHKSFIENNKRGYGYWIWKPRAILKVLNTMEEGDILLYCDAGCSLNVEGINRLNEYIDMTKTHDILTFELVHLEKTWNKMDSLKLLPEEKWSSRQRMATVIFMVNCARIRTIVSEWIGITADYHMIDDTPSIEENDPTFKEHRHDQSIFSIVCKLNNLFSISDETWFNNAWEQNKMFPIHATRLKY
ncbi:MAG: hypothetical protein Terrestrivirus1_52 [Terrestrivirus sp.]|uniref:Uncharacterized protein n=1 Tax=Terrestrivirus sp. TaxID=2487775 RepID=A0A3G4ZK16_9VIRU|nr:MAG: hypothetical protein Terrestrivirus1_52 [Terrestrivirus sp.]